MKRLQIKELAASIVRYDRFSDQDFDWVCSNFSKQDLRLFMLLLAGEIKNNIVTVSFAGELSDINKKKIENMFPNKKILFKHDDVNIGGGVRFEYSDFVLDCSLVGIVTRTLNAMREGL